MTSLQSLFLALGGATVAFIVGHRCAKREAPPLPETVTADVIESAMYALTVLFGSRVEFMQTAKGIAIACRSCKRYNRLTNGLKGAQCGACNTPLMVEPKAQA